MDEMFLKVLRKNGMSEHLQLTPFTDEDHVTRSQASEQLLNGP